MSTSSNKSRNILLTLPSVRHRENLISAVKHYNKTNSNDQLNSQQLGVTREISYIYVAEHLSVDSKELHVATIQAAQGKNKHVWVKYENVMYARTTVPRLYLLKILKL